MTQLRSTLPQQPQHILDEIGAWSLIVPEAGTNLVPNPSFENDTTGWGVTGTGATIARSTAYSAFGAASLLFSDAAASGAENTYTSNIAVSASTVYTWSFYYRKTAAAGQAGTCRLDYYTGASAYISSETHTFPAGIVGNWQRVSLTVTTPATAASVVLVYIAPASGAYSLYIDGVQLEARPYPTTYIDGEQGGCYWSGAPHASSSSRLATARQGGRIVPFKKYNWRTTALVGLQVAALNTISTPYALIGGGYYQRSVAPPRAFSIVGGFDCQSQIDLARTRNEMAQALVPFATAPDTPVRLVYEPLLCNSGAAAGQKVFIDAVYTGGLEGNQTNDVGIERHALGFRVHLPFAALGQIETDANVAITLQSNIANTSLVARRVTTQGEWTPTITALASGIANGEVTDGITWSGLPTFGTFYSVSPGELVQWNGSAFVSLGTVTGNRVDALAVDVDGDLLVGGTFTNIGGTAMSNVGAYDVGSSSWVAFGAGLNNTVNGIATTAGGVIIAGGNFTGYLAGWDGATWSTLGTFNGRVWAVKQRPGTNTVIAAGEFTSPATRIVQYTVGGGGSFAGMGSGFNARVNAIAIAPDGTVYAGGNFTASGAIAVNYIARWNGVSWLPLGAGVNNEVYGISIDAAGRLLVSGTFTQAGNVAVEGAAIWDGSNWVHPGFGSSSARTTGVLVRPEGEYWYGDFATLEGPAITTITINQGTTYPVIRITGPGTPVVIANLTTGDAIRLNYAISENEVVTITTGATPSIVSSLNGDILSFLDPSSNLATFRLVPGQNQIGAFLSGALVGSAMNFTYRELVSSLDQSYRP